MWLFLWAYSMELLSRKTKVPPNRPKGILSCRAWTFVFVVKKWVINVVPLGSYRSHSFSWKSWKFVKNEKNLQNLWASFFSYYRVKNEFQIYILVYHELAHSPTYFLLFYSCIKKNVFWCTLMISDTNDNAHN
jgi:hypothetical protein